MEDRQARVRLVAAFGAGVALWEAIVHVSLLLSGQSPRIFGLKLAPRVNLVQSIVPALTSLALAGYAFRRMRSDQLPA